MFAFLRRIGCLVVLLVAGLLAWMTRDLWWERVLGEPRRARAIEWRSGTPARATAVRERLEALARPSGVVYAAFTAADVASVVEGEVARLPSGSVREVSAAFAGDELQVRARVDLTRLGALGELGPVAAMLPSSARMTVSGIPSATGAGHGLFRVTAVRVEDVQLPGPVVERFLRRVLGAGRVPAREAGTVTFALPPYIGDLRVTNGTITLYKRVP